MECEDMNIVVSDRGYYELEVVQFNDGNGPLEVFSRDLIAPNRDFADVILFALRVLWEKTKLSKDERPIYEFRIVWRDD
jgi:hypothetical protein